MGSPETNVKFFTWLQIPVVWKILLFILRENELNEVLGSSIFPMPGLFCYLISLLLFCPKEGTLPGIHWLDFGNCLESTVILPGSCWDWTDLELGKLLCTHLLPISSQAEGSNFCHARHSVASALCEAEGC